MSRRGTRTTPPRLAEAVLSKLLPDEDRDAVIGELRELHEIECARKGAAAAGRWYVRQVIGFAWRIARHGRRSAPGIAGDTRGSGGWEMGMGSSIKDLGIAARSLARRPRFALGVALTLGLGIGATTTIYSVVDGVLFRPLPYDDPSTLVAVGALAPGQEWIDRQAGLQDLGSISVPN